MQICGVLILFLLIQLGICEESNDTLNRSKRSALLVFPFGGTFKIVLGIGMPIPLGIKQSMAIGWNLQWQYPCATNITQLQSYPPVVGKSRDKRNIENEDRPSDRALAYKGFEDILERHGINGQACLLRSICENAIFSTSHEINGLYGKLIHIALTPDYGDGVVEPDLDPIYFDAQRAGEYGVDCKSLFPNCNLKNGMLDLISVLDK